MISEEKVAALVAEHEAVKALVDGPTDDRHLNLEAVIAAHDEVEEQS